MLKYHNPRDDVRYRTKERCDSCFYHTCSFQEIGETLLAGLSARASVQAWTAGLVSKAADELEAY